MTDDLHLHQHRRMDDTDDGSAHRMERAAESTFAKVLTRFGMPVMLAVIGWFLIQANNRIEATQASQGKDITQIKSDVRDVNTRLDAQVIRQVDSNTKHIDKLEDRVQTLERSVRTP